MADGEEQLSCWPPSHLLHAQWQSLGCLWSYNDQLRWRLPEPGNPRGLPHCWLLTVATGFRRRHWRRRAAATVGGSDGYEKWLANALALGDQTIVVLGWQGMEARPSSPRVVPSLAGNVNVCFLSFFVS